MRFLGLSVVVILFLGAARFRLLIFILFHARTLFVLFRTLTLFILLVIFVVPHTLIDDVPVVTIFAHLFLDIFLTVGIFFILFASAHVFHGAFEIILHFDTAIFRFAVLIVFFVLLF